MVGGHTKCVLGNLCINSTKKVIKLYPIIIYRYYINMLTLF